MAGQGAVPGTDATLRSGLERVRTLIETRAYPSALAEALQLAIVAPENRDVLYSIAVSQRYLRQEQAALETLRRLQALHPDYSRLHQEIGYCRVGLRDGPGAIAAFLKAVHLNPALPGSWGMLERLYTMNGEAANAKAAAAHVAILAKLPPEIVTATSMFSDRELEDAERLVRAYLLQHGNHVEAMRLLARIGLEQDAFDDAELLLGAVLEMQPDYNAARFDYAMVLLRRHRHQAALIELERLCKSEPGNRVYATNLATANAGLGRHEEALAAYKKLAHTGPASAELQLSIGHCLKTMGDTPAAIRAYQEATRIRANFGDAYWSLANLKTYQFSDDELARMRAALASAETPQIDRCQLSFALAKALEDRKAWAESFAFYQQGNQIKKSTSRYRPEAMARNIDQQIEVCTTELFERHQRSGCTDPAPIFIVGLPRSGSTLIEQILATHQHVEGTMELADIPRIVQGLQGRETLEGPQRYPRVLASLTAADLLRLGEQYISGTRIYRRTNRRHFIDKMPNNFRHLGLIHLILPRARIIDARREPMACCFSNFKQLFAEGQEFTYSLEDIGGYYQMYVRLMRHWDTVLPGRVLRVQHEELVADLEGQLRRMLAFLELDYDPRCLEFHRVERSIRTASSEQVRRPIFTEGLDQWRNFEPWLAPLREALGPLAR
jgi:predicted Zn-dependent protease